MERGKSTTPGTFNANDRLDAAQVLEVLRARIRNRIGPLIAHLPAAEIEAVIDDIARIKFKYEGQRALLTTPAHSRIARAENND
jgi:hypothetical protein